MLALWLPAEAVRSGSAFHGLVVVVHSDAGTDVGTHLVQVADVSGKVMMQWVTVR